MIHFGGNSGARSNRSYNRGASTEESLQSVNIVGAHPKVMPDGRKTQVKYNGNGEFAISPAHPEWYLQRGLRVADLMISIDKGKSSEIAKQIINDNTNVVFITGRVNTIANVIARIYFSDSMMLRDTIESIKSNPYVSRVEFTEVVEIFGRKSDKQIEEDVKKLLDSSGRNW